MDVMDAGFGCIVDIGVAAAKKRFNLKLDEKKAHDILSDYLGRQKNIILIAPKTKRLTLRAFQNIFVMNCWMT